LVAGTLEKAYTLGLKKQDQILLVPWQSFDIGRMFSPHVSATCCEHVNTVHISQLDYGLKYNPKIPQAS
jgi:hypothetical protein